MGILDPSPYVDDQAQPPQQPPSAAWGGAGPLAAASGNVGALQRSLIGQQVAPGLVQQPGAGGPLGALAASRPIMSPEAGQKLEQSLLSRIRSPEQLQQAADARQGALSQLQSAIRQPADPDRTFDTNFMAGILQAPQWMNSNQAFRVGLSNAMQQGLKEKEQAKNDEVLAQKLGLDYLQKEDTSGDQAEKSALSDAARIMIAQNRLMSGGGLNNLYKARIIHTKDGIFQIQDDGTLKMVVQAKPDYTKLYDGIYRQVQKQAEDPRMQFHTPQEKNAWMQQQVQDRMNSVLQSDPTLPANGPIGYGGGSAAPVIPSTPMQPQSSAAVSNPLVAAVKSMESGGSQGAVSPAGAVGVMQVMPKTGPEAAKLAGLPWDPVKFKKDAAYNEQLGSAYLGAQMKKYGSEPLALIAYNWGPENTDQWLKAGADPRKLPQETRLYVGDVMAAKANLQNPPQAVTDPNQLPGSPATQAPGYTPPDPIIPAPGNAPLQDGTNAPQPANNGAPPQAAAPGPQLLTEGELNRQKEFSAADEKSAAKIMDSYRAAANQANDSLQTIDQIQMLRPDFTPGAFSGVRADLGRYMDALGLTRGGIPKEARTIQEVNRLIQEQVNNRMTEEHGVQTEGDAQRFQKAYANLKDTPQAFDFTMEMLRERALRMQDRLKLAEETAKQNQSNAGVETAWANYRDSQLGPMLLSIKGHTMFRNQYIDAAVKATMEKYPDADPDVTRQKAAQQWLLHARDYKAAKPTTDLGGGK